MKRCQNIRTSDQLWINYKIRQLNQAVSASAQSMGLTYVDIEDASEGHELCEDDPGFLHGIDVGNRVRVVPPDRVRAQRDRRDPLPTPCRRASAAAVA